MIVCVCKRVSDRQLRALARDGVTSVCEMQLETGCGTCCGKCLPMVREIADEAQQREMAGFGMGMLAA
ncbi:(2Fe-2S)-binding protein [Uliginosibacterium sp. H1]|uniref:(2Fe-2S)-binding protein n=1 Tax=Uliginosibacterium sp. H1 TaxID=3114757 RepID=UPI002E18A073|nr:(2Fe-2S)-binding protein [Uliginosibacterium sp. H1]